MKIAIYCGSFMGNENDYKIKAKTLARKLALKNFGIVYGGSKQGLMGIISNEYLKLSNNIVGVITHDLAIKEAENKNLSTIYKVNTMSERKLKMESLANAYITLPGGYGTLDEIFEILCHIQLGYNKKPCVFFNIDGYFDKLIDFLKDCVKKGFIQKRHYEMIIVSDDIDYIIEQIELYKSPKSKWEN